MSKSRKIDLYEEFNKERYRDNHFWINIDGTRPEAMLNTYANCGGCTDGMYYKNFDNDRKAILFPAKGVSKKNVVSLINLFLNGFSFLTEYTYHNSLLGNGDKVITFGQGYRNNYSLLKHKIYDAYIMSSSDSNLYLKYPYLLTLLARTYNHDVKRSNKVIKFLEYLESHNFLYGNKTVYLYLFLNIDLKIDYYYNFLKKLNDKLPEFRNILHSKMYTSWRGAESSYQYLKQLILSFTVYFGIL